MNPYQPPAPIQSARQAPWRQPSLLLMIGVAAGDLFVVGGGLSQYFALVSNGSLSPLPVLAALASSVLLYTAVYQMLCNLPLAQKLFVAAAVASGLAMIAMSLPSLRQALLPVFPASLLGFALAWRLRRAARSE